MSGLPNGVTVEPLSATTMSGLPQGVTLAPLGAEQKQQDALFSGRSGKTVLVQPHGWLLPRQYIEFAQEIKEFEFEEDMVVVMSFQKSGSTWMQEVIWTMRNSPDLDSPKAGLTLYRRSPFFETDIMVDLLQGPQPNLLKNLKRMPAPRTFKTHLSFDLQSPSLLARGKTVYMMRDPRDTCISFYYHCRLWKYEGFTGTFDQFVDCFLSDSMVAGPYMTHVKEAWKMRSHPNVLVLSYDKVLKAPQKYIKQLDTFLGTELSDDQMEKIAEHTSFSGMKRREADLGLSKDGMIDLDIAEQDGGKFLKKGESGRNKRALTADQQNKFSAWVEKHELDAELKHFIFSH